MERDIVDSEPVAVAVLLRPWKGLLRRSLPADDGVREQLASPGRSTSARGPPASRLRARACGYHDHDAVATGFGQAARVGANSASLAESVRLDLCINAAEHFLSVACKGEADKQRPAGAGRFRRAAAKGFTTSNA